MISGDGRQVGYVGTRLHGGIRALQKDCRAHIVAIDQRGHAIDTDTELSVVDRKLLGTERPKALDGMNPLHLRLPENAIHQFKQPFKEVQAHQTCIGTRDEKRPRQKDDALRKHRTTT